jgi:hypothetical protein
VQVLAGHNLPARGAILAGHGLTGNGQSVPGIVAALPGWYRFGDWDIRVPTGEAISALIAWEFEGAWNIHTPTDPDATPSWTVPDRAEAQGYTIWEIGVPT